ncbi:MAG: glycoside hydrolase family 2, partial [Cupriavidus sp.]
MRFAILPTLLLSSLLLAGSVSAADNEGERIQSLDGKWSFTTDPAMVEKSSASWDTLEVPGNWDVQPAYSTHRGKGWYQREFTVPADWKGRQVRLVFDAVYHEATVTLNGQTLGSHTGGYTPFEFNVSNALKYGEANTIQVCADNTYGRGAWWPWGGISRSVYLVADSDARIVWQ